MKKIAVIILNWNGEDLLRKFLPSVCAHTNANIADVIVVDNGSDDNSVEVLKQEFPQVKTLLFPQNYGFAAGYNKALEMLDYKYAVLLNSDVETTPHWLEPLLEFAEGNLDVAACQPKIKSLRKREEFEYAGAAGGFIDRYGYPFCRGRIFNTLETDRGQYDDICDIFWASGAALFVRSEIYKKVGGLDPSSRTWKRLIFAGASISQDTASLSYRKARSITWEEHHSMPPIPGKPISTFATTF